MLASSLASWPSDSCLSKLEEAWVGYGPSCAPLEAAAVHPDSFYLQSPRVFSKKTQILETTSVLCPQVDYTETTYLM